LRSPIRYDEIQGRAFALMSLDELLDRYHRAADAFSRGDPGPVKELYSSANDVTLANPFGPARRGREAVMGALDCASSQAEVVSVSAPLIDDPQSLAKRFRKALDVPTDLVEWEASDSFWNESRGQYDRDDWLAQRRRLGHLGRLGKCESA
jgi:hypothetical protein